MSVHWEDLCQLTMLTRGVHANLYFSFKKFELFHFLKAPDVSDIILEPVQRPTLPSLLHNNSSKMLKIVTPLAANTLI